MNLSDRYQGVSKALAKSKNSETFNIQLGPQQKSQSYLKLPWKGPFDKQFELEDGKKVAMFSHPFGLKSTFVFQGQLDKNQAYLELRQRVGLTDQQIAFVGDDVVDLPVMRQAGLAIAVQDAHPFVKQHAHWQTPSRGGRGAARDVCEMIMEAQGTLQSLLASYLG